MGLKKIKHMSHFPLNIVNCVLCLFVFVLGLVDRCFSSVYVGFPKLAGPCMCALYASSAIKI